MVVQRTGRCARAARGEAVAHAPNNAAIVDTLGWILVKQGHHAEGLTVLRSAVTGAPKDAEIRYHYAVALAKTGAADEARSSLQEALRQTSAFPSRADAERLLKELSNGATATARRLGIMPHVTN